MHAASSTRHQAVQCAAPRSRPSSPGRASDAGRARGGRWSIHLRERHVDARRRATRAYTCMHAAGRGTVPRRPSLVYRASRSAGSSSAQRLRTTTRCCVRAEKAAENRCTSAGPPRPPPRSSRSRSRRRPSDVPDQVEAEIAGRSCAELKSFHFRDCTIERRGRTASAHRLHRAREASRSAHSWERRAMTLGQSSWRFGAGSRRRTSAPRYPASRGAPLVLYYGSDIDETIERL